MTEVFISYAREDRTLVRIIAETLERGGLEVFWDTTALGSSNFMGKLEAELRRSHCVIVCWSRRAVRSQWVLSESRAAASRGKLFPVKIEPIENSDIPPPFSDLRARDLSSWQGSTADRQWRYVWDDVRSLLLRRSGKSQLPDPAAIRSAIRAEVEKAGGSVPQSHVAFALMARWPAEASASGWFGYKRFGHFFQSLGLDDLALDATGPGRIVNVQPGALNMERREPVPVSEFQAALAARVFKATGAPQLSPVQYRAIFTTVAEVIQAGAVSLAEITCRARDDLASSGTPVGRERISFAAKGALIDGLNVNRRPMEPLVVAQHYANALAGLCKSSGLELDPVERNVLLGVVGFGDEIASRQNA